MLKIVWLHNNHQQGLVYRLALTSMHSAGPRSSARWNSFWSRSCRKSGEATSMMPAGSTSSSHKLRRSPPGPPGPTGGAAGGCCSSSRCGSAVAAASSAMLQLTPFIWAPDARTPPLVPLRRRFSLLRSGGRVRPLRAALVSTLALQGLPNSYSLFFFPF